MANLTILDSPHKVADTALERVRTKRRRLESKMGQRWNRRLSLEIDQCLFQEELLRCPIRRMTTA
jgi:hypothetical protein